MSMIAVASTSVAWTMSGRQGVGHHVPHEHPAGAGAPTERAAMT